MCTGIRIQATNGDYVYARTMEFDTPLPTNLGYAPRGTKYTGLTTTGADGISWEHKYAVGGQTGPRGCSDAMNEKGVVAGGFNLPGYTEFTAVTDQNRSKALAIEQACAYILGNYASTAEAKDGILAGDFFVADTPFPFVGSAPGQLPLHVRIGDPTGATVVIEWHTAGSLPAVYDAPTGIITNAPAYNWHQANATQFQHLSPYNPYGPFTEGNQDYKEQMGNGYVGLPGGSNPPDRFVRATTYSRDTYQAATGADAVWTAWHIMNNYDIPPGILRNIDGNTNKESSEYALWTSVADTANCCYYFRTHENNNIYKLDLKAQDPTGPKLLTDPAPGAPTTAFIAASLA